jgi:hypothetical protein
MRWREERAGWLGKMNNTTASMADGAESRRCNPIGCFWPPFDTRLVPNKWEARGELTGEEKGRRGQIGISVWLKMAARWSCKVRCRKISEPKHEKWWEGARRLRKCDAKPNVVLTMVMKETNGVCSSSECELGFRVLGMELVAARA